VLCVRLGKASLFESFQEAIGSVDMSDQLRIAGLNGIQLGGDIVWVGDDHRVYDGYDLVESLMLGAPRSVHQGIAI
jgi:hypothetical protein